MSEPVHDRAAWGARAARPTSTNVRSEGETVHYGGKSPWGSVNRNSPNAFRNSTSHSRCATILRAWQAYHIDVQGWVDLGYNMAVCPHGHVYVGRGAGRRSAGQGTDAGNYRSEAIVYIAGGSDPLTDEAKRGFYVASQQLTAKRLRWGHRDWRNTLCPGSPLYSWRTQGFPHPGGDAQPPPSRSWFDMATREDLVAVIDSRVPANLNSYFMGDTGQMALSNWLGRALESNNDAVHGPLKQRVNEALHQYFMSPQGQMALSNWLVSGLQSENPMLRNALRDAIINDD